MKNIIVVGPPRAGKTTLARRLNEELDYFVISLDKLVATLAGAYPQLDVRLNWNREKTTDHIAPFLGHFLGVFSSAHGVAQELNLRAHAVEDNHFVLEGAYFHFEKISSILKAYGMERMRDHFILIGLVQNRKTVDSFVNDLKTYDTPNDWTYGFGDDDLWEVAENELSFSRSMTEELATYGFTVYDMSTERERVFDQIMDDIRSALR